MMRWIKLIFCVLKLRDDVYTYWHHSKKIFRIFKWSGHKKLLNFKQMFSKPLISIDEIALSRGGQYGKPEVGSQRARGGQLPTPAPPNDAPDWSLSNVRKAYLSTGLLKKQGLSLWGKSVSLGGAKQVFPFLPAFKELAFSWWVAKTEGFLKKIT